MADFLPSLATLHLGAPADDTVEDERRTKAQRIVISNDESDGESGSHWVSPPPPAILWDMPPELIEVLVRQAALSARKAHFVAREICLWMRNFCEVAASSGVPCDDDWFRLALGAFGPVPEGNVSGAVYPTKAGATNTGYVNAVGETVDAPAPSAPPPQSGFTTWRQLFEQLCVALDGPEARRLRTPEEIATRVPPSFWDHVMMAMYGRRNGPPRYVYVHQYADASLTRRRLDVLLDALLARLPAAAADGPLVRAWDLDELKEQWETWLCGDALTADWQREVGPWKALLTSLLLRGANPFLSPIYNSLDMDLYIAITRAINGEVQWEVALAAVRAALNAGASPNYDGNSMNYGEHPVPLIPQMVPRHFPHNPEHIPKWPSVLNLALWSANHELVKLLVDAGARYEDDHRVARNSKYFNFFWLALRYYYFKRLGPNILRMPESDVLPFRETALKLAKMVEEHAVELRDCYGRRELYYALKRWTNRNGPGGTATALAADKHITPDWLWLDIGRIQNLLED